MSDSRTNPGSRGKRRRRAARLSGSRESERVRRLIAAEQAANLAGASASRWRAQLTAATDSAVSDPTLDEFLDGVLVTVRDLLEADTVSFLAANESRDELVTRTSVGLSSRVVEVSMPVGAGMAGSVAAGRQPVVIDDLSKVELASPTLRALGIRSVVAVPVLTGDELLGVLHAGSYERAFFSETDAATLTLVADRISTAMDRVRLFESERDARLRAETLAGLIANLQNVTVALSGQLSDEEITEIVSIEASRALAGSAPEVPPGCALWLARGDSLVLFGPARASRTALEFQTMEIEADLPACEAFRTREAIWIRSKADLRARYPASSTVTPQHDRLAILPLVVHGDSIGLLSFGFAGEGDFEVHERAYLVAVTEQAAQAFDRARLRRNERQAAERNRLLASISGALGESLDYTETLDKVVRLLVPQVVDLAVVHVMDSSGRLVREALAHRDPELDSVIRESVPERGHPSVVAALERAAAEGEARYFADFASLVASDAPAELFSDVAELLAPLGLGAAMLVPLVEGARRMGALFVAQLAGGRDLDEATRHLLADVAGRSAVAIGNARLHWELRESQRSERFLLDVATAIAGAGGYQATLDRLATTAVPTLGDLCLIDVIEEERLARRVAHHADPTMRRYVDRLRDYPPDLEGEHPSALVIRDGRTLWSPQMPKDFLRSTTRGDEHLDIVSELDFSSYIAVPLAVGGTVLGSLTLVASASRRQFDLSDVRLAERLASQVAAVVEKARRYEIEHDISHVLQQSLLPSDLPELEGVHLAVRYLPGTDDAEVGGDFYDAMALPDGSLFLVIGDVAGHDHHSAAMMGLLRSAVRTLAAQGGDPRSVVKALREDWELFGFEKISTAMFSRLDPRTGAIAIASAGHPPPLVVSGKEAHYLPVPVTPPLGAPAPGARDWRGRLSKEILLFYTDGLVDDRHGYLADRMDELVLLAAGHTGDSETLCDRIVEEIGTDRSDDIALLAVSRSGPEVAG